MQIRRKLRYENVSVTPTESFATRQFRLGHFPFAWHYHPEVELTLIMKGHGTRFVGDSVEHFAAGDLCLLGANLPHTWYTEPADGRVHSRVLQFRPDFWGAAFDRLPEMQPVRRLLDRSTVGFAINGSVQQRVTAWITELLSSPVGSAARIALLLRILGELATAPARELRPLAAGVPAPAHDEHADTMIATILRRLNAAPSQPPKQSELAALAGISAPALSRLFKRRVGTTYPEYINSWRIARVCRELAGSDRFRDRIAARGIDPIIPYRWWAVERRYDDGWKRRRYKHRWVIERLFAWLGNFRRRLVVRYERKSRMYQGFVHVAFTLIALRQL